MMIYYRAVQHQRTAQGGDMASYDVLRDIVRNGSNLVVSSGISYDVLRELAAIASKTGAITTSISYDLLRELLAAYENTITHSLMGLNRSRKSEDAGTA
jgi:hypothetical protein